MAITDEDLAALLSTTTHTEEIDAKQITPGDHIDPELVDGKLVGDNTDDDGMQIGLIETDDGHLIRAHRPGDEFVLAADDVEPAEYDPNWIVDRVGNFSAVLSETGMDTEEQ